MKDVFQVVGGKVASGEVMHSFHIISLPLPQTPTPSDYYGCLLNRGQKIDRVPQETLLQLV